MTPDLQERVLTRLQDSGAADQPLALIVLAALDGAGALEAYLDGTATRTMPAKTEGREAAARPEPPGVYVSAITVEGFRGVGDAATLTIPPGPGLVLVVGRNGSGKSSFAEGLELLLTARNYRWEKRTKVWREGWRNLHQRERVSVKADLVVEAQGPLTVTRTWASDDVAVSETVVEQKGKAKRKLDAIGWTETLETFRPFLSYNELGSLLEEGPSKLYDALSSVLGLEALVDVQTTLTNTRKSRQKLVDDARREAEGIRAMAEAAPAKASDERLAAAIAALGWPRWDLPALTKLATGGTTDQTSELATLSQLQAIPRPDAQAIADIVSRLRSAAAAAATFAGTSAERSSERAQLLEDALAYHDKHDAKDCPVCGSGGTLSAKWRTKTGKEIAALRKEAAACEAADKAVTQRLSEAQKFIGAPPAVLARATTLGLESLAAARDAAATWAQGRELDSPAALAAHMAQHASAYADALEMLAEEAMEAARKREDVWRPLALSLAAWLPRAKAALRAHGRTAELKAAETWWKEASEAIRDERFAPVADRAKAIWQQLRLQSHVDLGGIELEGNAQRRRVTLKVTVDGTEAEALGVMSQGELHALALSLFLPRATLPESPFRFVWIDDPVQSMDPARVDGLARVLADTARTRQVVVFTHDDRLPDAVRRLGIPATGFAVTRRANSKVEVKPAFEPVRDRLDDAWAIAKSEGVSAGVAERVVPGFCRAAIEAACMEVVRKRRLGRGETHEAVETLLADNATTHPLMALALFDDAQRTSDVLAGLNKLGAWSANAFQACKKGAHERYAGGLEDLVRDAEKLALHVRSKQ